MITPIYMQEGPLKVHYPCMPHQEGHPQYLLLLYVSNPKKVLWQDFLHLSDYFNIPPQLYF